MVSPETAFPKVHMHIPIWLQDSGTHLWIFSLAVVLGIAICKITLASRSGQLMDIYHDVVIAPFILYAAITLLPVIWFNSTLSEKLATELFLIVWIILIIFDFKHDRINQRQWLIHRVGQIGWLRK